MNITSRLLLTLIIPISSLSGMNDYEKLMLSMGIISAAALGYAACAWQLQQENNYLKQELELYKKSLAKAVNDTTPADSSVHTIHAQLEQCNQLKQQAEDALATTHQQLKNQLVEAAHQARATTAQRSLQENNTPQ